jgi:hypothetical protein
MARIVVHFQLFGQLLAREHPGGDDRNRRRGVLSEDALAFEMVDGAP